MWPAITVQLDLSIAFSLRKTGWSTWSPDTLLIMLSWLKTVSPLPKTFGSSPGLSDPNTVCSESHARLIEFSNNEAMTSGHYTLTRAKKRKRDHNSCGPEQRAKIARYAIDNGMN